MSKRTLLYIGLLFELIAVFGLFVPYAYRMNTGTLITLKTVPVDPRSIFMGDYVQLRYEVGQNVSMDSSGATEFGPASVVLAKRGEVFERVSVFSASEAEGRPQLDSGQVCLRGYAEPSFFGDGRTYSIAFPDIAQYYVEEGTGRELESAQNAHRLLVDIVVSDDCSAIIRGVRLGETAPLEEPTLPADDGIIIEGLDDL